MPALPSTLEPIRFLIAERTHVLWSHVASALTYIHDLGFAHGNIKPSNIGISNNVDFVLIDLGALQSSGNVSIRPQHMFQATSIWNSFVLLLVLTG
jgi:serine/threonine protein kinase